MIHDGKINIATGTSAQTKFWQNETWSWAKLVNRLRKPNYTNETYQEFIRLSKKEQGKIKDVGGYVGAYLKKGKRSPSEVVHRQLMTLDIDFAHKDFWEDFEMTYDNAAILHSTHKHSEASPRFRLVMPMSRKCTPDEYVAVSRKLAGTIGIELFDNTTFETNRLMFWQSTPRDMQYSFEYQDGPWIDVDEMLAVYEDWRDTSLWPTADRKLNQIATDVKKQQDPTDKPGLIGAFCRTYTVTEAIATFLNEEYDPTYVEDRYSYTKGSTASGLIVYEDKFTYSHHGTDPTGGKLCNSFDLVRIHKYGYLDDTDEKQDGKSPSFKAMETLIMKDRAVSKQIAKERMNEATDAFSDGFEVEEEDMDWMTQLDKDKGGKYLSTSKNINLIFKKDPRLSKAFRHNEFDRKKYVVRTMPWRKVLEPGTLRDLDLSGVRNYFDTVYSISGNTKIEDSLMIDFEKFKYHPIKTYFKGLSWDETPRVDTMLIEYYGVKDSIYTREAIRKWLVGAVGRIIKPGIKFDLVLTLVGPQGSGKSTFGAKLAGEWFSDSFDSVSGRSAFEQLQGQWLLEMAELSALRKAEVESIKHFISKQDDTYRAAYGRTTETHKRQCVFLGTTNNKDFLRDPSGNRRFMPIDVRPEKATKSIFDISQEEVDQIWAEAIHLFKNGEKLFLSRDAEKLANVEQKSHSEVDDRTGVVGIYLDSPLPSSWDSLDVTLRRDYLEGIKNEDDEKDIHFREFVCVAEVWCECLGNRKQDMSRFNTREINDILKGMDDWEYVQATRNFPLYGKQRYYKRKLY